MASADMWWAQTNVWHPGGISVNYGGGRWRITGQAEGPGCGAFSCSETTEVITFLSQYGLDRERMPDAGCVFRSSPAVDFTGVIHGLTGDPFAFFDHPSAACELQARQLVFFGAQLTHVSFSSLDLVSIIDETLGWQVTAMPSIFHFDAVSFQLDRGQDLLINLEVKFIMRLEGSGTIRYSPWIDSPPFNVHFSQWPIQSVD